MKLGFSWPVVVLALAGCASVGGGAEVRVTNELDLARPQETVSVPWGELARCLPEITPEEVEVVGAGNEEALLTQALDADGDGEVDELLFQADLGPGETRRFLVRPSSGGERPAPERRTFGRFVPERMDDFAWENDLVAFRMYGPALAADPVNSGIDCWLKRVPYPIVDKWYREDQEGKSYHTDHGEGYDPYHVGSSRGCGGLAIWDGDELHPSNVFSSWKVIANGPIRTVFELTYDPWEVNGRTITEVKRVSIDLGHRLTRFESTFRVDGEPEQLLVAIGITTHDGAADWMYDTGGAGIWCWEEIDGSDLGTGAAIYPWFTEMFAIDDDAPDEDHVLGIARTDGEGKITYLAGYAWEREGGITTPEEWEAYLWTSVLRMAYPPNVVVSR